MAIKIVQRPADIPGPVTLPARIEVAQILSSTKTSEPVTLVYQLPDDSGLLFDDGEASASRDETIARASTPLRHRLQIVRVLGSGPLRVTIDENILNPEGEVLQATSFDLFVK
jgi:hypothetical protein